MDQSFEVWIARFPTGAGFGTGLAAVWASSRIDCEATLRRTVLEHGGIWAGVRTAEALAAMDGAARSELPPGVEGAGVGPRTPVVFLDAAGAAPAGRSCAATALPAAGPLTPADTGAVPADLLPHLFPGDGRGTFAVLDAGQIPGLPETLDASGLEFRCLYIGEGAEDLRDTAPYLVRLDPGHSLTRRLFTDGTPPAALWPVDYGVFALSALSVDDLRGHFRRFTQVSSPEGKRLFLRFWTAPVMTAFVSHGAPDPLISALLAKATLIFRDFASVRGPRIMALSAAAEAAA